MRNRVLIAHDIPGRLRLIIPGLGEREDLKAVEKLFSSIEGVWRVRIEPLIYSMLVEYDNQIMSKHELLQYISIFFKQIRYDPLDDLMVNVKPGLRRDLFRSLLTGVLLFIAYTRKTSASRPDMLDYLVSISAGYTVLSHGTTDKLKHPDVITGLVSMFSLGTNNILQVASITWLVNLFELFQDLKRKTW